MNDVNRKVCRTLSLFAGAACALAAAGGVAAEWRPHEPVEMLVGVGAGGAHDRTARLIQSIWQKNGELGVPLVITNKPGGGGARVLVQLNQESGKPHYLAVTGPTLLTNRIIGAATLTYTDFTQIAILYSEAIAFAVPANSPIKDGKELVRRLVKEPSGLTIGIATARGNTNHIAMASVTKVAGGDPRKLRVVIFDSGGKVATALMGGHVDVVASNASNLLAQSKRTNGLRLLAVSAPERVSELADVPTWRELGVNSVVGNFRGVMGAKGLTAAQVAYWEGAFERLSEQKEWRRVVENNCGFGKFMNSSETVRYLEEEYAELQSVLRSLDMAK